MRTFCIVLLFFCISQVSCQSFNNRVIYDKLNLFFNNLDVVDDTIVVYGYNNVLEPYLKVKLNITKFTSHGEIVEQKVLMLDSFRNYIPWYQGATNKNDVGKTLISGSGDEESINDQAFTLLLNNNNLEWVYHYTKLDGTLSSINTASILLEDNSSYNVIIDRASSFNYQARIAHLDGEGKLVWEKFYIDPDYYYSPFSIIMDSDSNLIVGSTRVTFHSSELERTIHSVLWRVDKEGNILDEFIDSTFTKNPNRIIQIQNDAYIFIDERLVEFDDELVSISRINRMSANFEKIWSIEVGKPFISTELHNLIATNDGNYIAVGRSSNFDIEPICHCGHVVKFNSEGEIMWESYIGKSLPYESNTIFTQNVFYDIKELESGGYIAVGESRVENDSFPQQGWIVRMDEMGQVTHTFPIPLYDDNSITVYPNPASNYVKLSSDNYLLDNSQVQVFSMQGALLLDENYQDDMLDVSALPKGIYSVIIDGKYIVRMVLQ